MEKKRTKSQEEALRERAGGVHVSGKKFAKKIINDTLDYQSEHSQGLCNCFCVLKMLLKKTADEFVELWPKCKLLSGKANTQKDR